LRNFCHGHRRTIVEHSLRTSTHGFTLLATLATILLLATLLLATLLLTLQTRSQANLRLIAQLTSDLQERAARDSLGDRLRGLVADTMSAAANQESSPQGRPTLDGAPLILREGGKDWVVRVKDVEGQLPAAAPRLPFRFRQPQGPAPQER